MVRSRSIHNYLAQEGGVAAIEAALLFPILIFLLIGIVDVGNAVLAGQKAIRASQVTADLIARKASVSTNDINEAVEAARLTMSPFDPSLLGVDIASLRFVEDDEIEPCWRETRGMEPNDDVTTSTIGLGVQGDGLLAVTVQFQYVPVFSYVFTGPITMREVAYVRGRKSPIIERDNQCW